jgi:hypothetical protein
MYRSKSILGPWTSSQHNMVTSGSVNNWGANCDSAEHDFVCTFQSGIRFVS